MQRKKKLKWRKIQNFSKELFRRITGVKQSTFAKMVEIITTADRKKKAGGGRPNKLCIEDRILMTLEYLREYRTYAHIGASYGLSESNAYQTIRWIENILVKSEEFRLPGRKALLKSENEFEVILIDATESPIERPKKNSVSSIRGKRNDIL